MLPVIASAAALVAVLVVSAQGASPAAQQRKSAPAGSTPTNSSAAVLKEFVDRVDKYVELHKKLKKVTAAIMADQVRVSSPSKDELQEAMRQLREQDFGCALQFGNYRG